MMAQTRVINKDIALKTHASKCEKVLSLLKGI